MSDSRVKHPGWRKSSYSGAGNDCVEIAVLGNGAQVRDSKAPGEGTLLFRAESWRAFLVSTRNADDNP